MLRAEVMIPNSMGIHARPASKLVRIASRSKNEVFLIKNGQRVNAKSILGVIMLEAEKGSTITIEIPDSSMDNNDELTILEDMVQLVRDGFGEK